MYILSLFLFCVSWKEEDCRAFENISSSFVFTMDDWIRTLCILFKSFLDEVYIVGLFYL